MVNCFRERKNVKHGYRLDDQRQYEWLEILLGS